MLEAKIACLVPLVSWVWFQNARTPPPPTSAVLAEHPAAALGFDRVVVATWWSASQAQD
jgi:hypothetical protein